MVQVKTFPLDDYKGFNDFVKEHSPRGENGIKFNTTHIMVFYDEGEIMNKSDRIQALKFELGKHLEQQMHYDKQMRMAKRIRDSFDKVSAKVSWDNGNAQLNSTRKMLELEIMGTDTIAEMLKELGEVVEYTNATVLPEEIDETLVPSPMNGVPPATTGKKGNK